MSKLYNTWKSFGFIGQWVTVMFPYGFIRQFNTVPKENEKGLIVEKIIFSTVNGLMYLSPVGIIKLFNTMARAEIAMSGQNPKDHSIYYYEFGNNNNNVLF